MDKLVQMSKRCNGEVGRSVDSLRIVNITPDVFNFLSTRIPVKHALSELHEKLQSVGLVGEVELRLRADDESFYVVYDLKSQMPDDRVLDLVESITLELDPCFSERLAGAVVVAEGLRASA